ncbi:hypothetical protein B0I37DRAFT_153888 [Chaetomium sp. MPI-CAGE-AT-0009]|nr:hypothetical protein B0I37DRAFT_153888 [Chaetomium sp. MPI-CAGE-AT-0009]
MEEERTITLDLGSSPDPLIDPILSPPMMPPSAIKKKSQAAEHLFTALAPSPRKQTFELDVGDERTPQRLRVTVEAEDEGTRSTSRRLFQSPTPKQRRLTPRRETIVTTTVPLRGLSDDEGGAPSNATPRRRGRPRKSGTPATTRRKRPGTPAKGRKSVGRTSVSPQKDTLASDIGVETTPRPTKRKATSPAKDGAPGSQPRKRGRPRKQTITGDEVARLGQEIPSKDEDHDSASITPVPNQPSGGMEEDIWLSTLSGQPTPAPQRQEQSYEPELPTSDHRVDLESQLPRQEPEYQQYDWSDMGGGADSYSEAGSLASDQDFENTVMAEEFTMISIGSLPSMQPNSSVMAPAHEELGEATSLIINGALESLRQSQNRPVEEIASPEPSAPLTEAQPSAVKSTSESRVQQHQELQLPPPPSSPQTLRRSPRRATAQPLAKQLAHKSLQRGDRQSPAPRQPSVPRHSPKPQQSPASFEPQNTSTYDDSFSEIPEAVLAAATPGRYRQPQQQTEEAAEDIQPSIERPSRTPSPIPSDTEDHNPPTKPPRPTLDVDLHSSPPIESPVLLSNAAAHHIRRNSTETPADQLSSFTSSNLGARDPNPVHLPLPEPHRRPTLSPIVRAGRALQLITSDPPSPPERGSVLGSPFRSSVPKSSQSPVPVLPPAAPAAGATQSPSQPRIDPLAKSPSRSWLAPLSQMKDFIVRRAQSLSPARVSVSGTDNMDDPFGPDPGELAASGSVRTTLFSGPGRQENDRDATVSVASSTGANSVHDDDEMSWQGEGSPAGHSQRSASPVLGNVEGRKLPNADRNRLSPQEEPANRPDFAMSTTAPATRPQAVLDQQEQTYEEEEEEEEEEDDIWAIEAQRPAPFAPRNVPARREPAPEPPRRIEIPSTWGQNNRRLISSNERDQYSNNGAHERNASTHENDESSRPAQVRTEQVPVRFERSSPMEDEEFSMLSQTRQRRPAAPTNQPVKKPDLSAFFSSPAILPDMDQALGAGLSKAVGSQEPQQTDSALPKLRNMRAQRQQSSGNSLFAQYLQPQAETRVPSVPQKQLEVDLFSPVRNTVGRSSLEQPTAPIPQSSSPQSVEEAAPGDIPQRKSLAPQQRLSATSARAAAPIPRAVSLESEEDAPMEHIPQKKNFTPRRRQANNTLFQPKPVAPTNSLFGDSQISSFFSRSRPQPQRPQTQSRADEEEEEESSFVSPPRKALPNRAGSPTKSCIRSPHKPKTPGRVVEFTSSTLSPLAQAQARAERRASMSPEKNDRTRSSRRSVLTNNNTEADKENRSSSPSLSLSPSPSPSPQPTQPRPTLTPLPPTSTTTTSATTQQQPQPLSPTKWTRVHWLRLDELLQARKRGPRPLQLALARSSNRPASSLPPVRQLLGKQVVAQGERMEIQAWHLDVVEGFLGELGGDVGWGGTQIAKRVFALLVGEERRRLGLVPSFRGGRHGSIGGWEREQEWVGEEDV